MNITKLGHCCLLIETNNKRILTDPGIFTVETHQSLTDIDLVLITHEHKDHFHSESLKELLVHNPQATVVTNQSVGNLLTNLGIAFETLEGTESKTIKDILLQAYDGTHEEIFEEYGLVQNTGYFIDDHLFYPGDSYTNPNREVPVLALPVAGPWCKVTDALHYVLKIAPQKAFPVHDAVLNKAGRGVVYPHFERELTAAGTKWLILEENQAQEV